MPEHLFVYGTLMTAAAQARLGVAERKRLQHESTSLGSATMRGRLYDLGAYPALVLADDAKDLVYGELLKLVDPATSFAWLDAYENAAPGTSPHDYQRVIRSVRLASGGNVEAWVYVYAGALGTARSLAEGRWQPC